MSVQEGRAEAPTAAGEASSVPRFALLRLYQWPKNLFVFAGVFFGQRVWEPGTVQACAVACLLFCTVSSAVYILNDLADIELDRNHPKKRFRPIASGAVGKAEALFLMGAFLVLGFGGAFMWMRPILWVLLAYVGINVAYSMLLKHLFLIDVFVIGAGFILRVYAGCVAIAEPISDWVLLCTGALSLFLALCKRRMEWTEEQASASRTVLDEYGPALTDQLITVAAVATMIFYGFYCSELNDHRRADSSLLWTIPPVVYGILHYLRLVQKNLGSGRSLILDIPLVGAIGVWLMISWVVLY